MVISRGFCGSQGKLPAAQRGGPLGERGDGRRGRCAGGVFPFVSFVVGPPFFLRFDLRSG